VATVRAAVATSGLAVDARAVQQLLTGTDPGARELGRRLGQQALTTLRSLIDRIAAALDTDPHASEPPRSLAEPADAPAPVDPEPGESDYLRTILFFNRFSAAQLDELFGGLRRLAAPRGAELVPAGARPDALLFVLRGAVESTLRRGGAAARVRLSGPGRIVTHLGVLDGGPTPYACRARERAVLLEVPAERFAGLDAGTDAAARLFWHGVFQDVADAIVHAERPLARMAAAR
jgi:hypothetical protein